jgi:hypothetical protein
MRELFRYRIGRQIYQARRIRVCDFISIMCASADLARAGSDIQARHDAFSQIADTLAEISEPRPAFDNVPISHIAALTAKLWAWSLGPIQQDGDETQAESHDEGRRFSRAELMIPVLKVSCITNYSLEQLLLMEFCEFSEFQKTVEAAWADFRLDLAEIVMLPHVREDDRRKITRGLKRKVRGLRPKDHSPWRSHIEEYQNRLEG